MQPLTLSPSLHLGIEAIDRQHGELVAMINETQEILRQEQAGSELVQIVNRLHALCIEHFSTEEILMRDADYPGFSEHKQMHDDSLERSFNFEAGRLAHDAEAGRELLQLLSDWLLAHIETDREMADFLKARGIS